tara:strand:- start:129 stop:455 length:327 start_codon:yes stop_codon:yes gene_type:complete
MGRIDKIKRQLIEEANKKLLGENKGMDFYLEELSEFEIDLEGGHEQNDGLSGYDIYHVSEIINQAREDETLTDNEWSTISEYGEDIINALSDESEEERRPTDQSMYWS